MSREADRLAEQEKAPVRRNSARCRARRALRAASASTQYGYSTKEQYEQAQKLADERQRLADDLAATAKADARRPAGSCLQPTSRREQASRCARRPRLKRLENRIQRSADWLRRGVNPNSPDTEQQIASGLQKLSDQVHQAQQALGEGQQQGGGHRSRSHRAAPQSAASDEPGRPQRPGAASAASRDKASSRVKGNQTGQGSQSAQGGRGDNQPGSIGQRL